MIIHTPYCLGFAFSTDRRDVLLIQKKRPDWMAGKLNGIGGLVHSDEIPMKALIRETEEETGLFIDSWEHVIDMHFTTSVIVSVYRAFSDDIYHAVQRTDEMLVLNKVQYMNTIIDNENPQPDSYVLIPNLYWMIPLCLDRHLITDPRRRRLGSHNLFFEGEET